MATNPLSGIRTYDPMTANAPKDATTTVDNSPAAQTQNFLKLLIAQIQNQDPMAPMDASTMTAQMSQLNMVSSMATMNTSMTAMLAQMQSANFMNQASLIGHSPAVVGGDIKYSGGGNVDLAVNATAPLQTLVATLTDENGNLVESVSLGAVPAGMTNFTWAGTDQNGNQMPAGSYKLTLAGKDATGKANNPTPYVASPVTSVSKGADGNAILNLLDGSSMSAIDVQQWLN
jgi:flagellar basal-body rod modification protein FlgD